MSIKVHTSSYVDEGAEIGAGTSIWHFCHIMSGAHIGESCSLGQNVVVSPGVKLGKGCKVQNNISIYTGVICGDYVFLGPSMVFTNVINPRAAIIRKTEYKQTMIGDHVSIGANATIVCGITIGKFAFVGAGAVVVKDIPEYALVVGNPSKQIGWVSAYGHRLHFDENGAAVCQESGVKYSIKAGIVTQEI